MNKNIKKVDKDDYEMINTIGLGLNIVIKQDLSREYE